MKTVAERHKRRLMQILLILEIAVTSAPITCKYRFAARGDVVQIHQNGGKTILFISTRGNTIVMLLVAFWSNLSAVFNNTFHYQ